MATDKQYAEISMNDYKDKQAKTKESLKRIGEKLAKHSADKRSDPRNWGYNGDLGFVLSQLSEIEQFLDGTG